MLIDTHIHFGGSIPLDCLWEIIKRNKWNNLSATYADLEKSMIYDGTGGFSRFLDMFKILDEINWTEDVLDQTIKAFCAAHENTDFIWLDLSINKYMKSMSMREHELIKFFHDQFKTHAKGKIAIVLSVKYESLKSQHNNYFSLIDDSKVSDLIAGIDLVGDENYFDHIELKGPLTAWNKAGKMVRVHVGELGNGDNVELALKHLPITNIAHGIDIINYPETIGMAIDRDIQFDLAITSNIKIRCLDYCDHPIHRMNEHGLKLTIGSDDPVIFGTTLLDEYKIVGDQSFQEKLVAQSILFNRKFGYK